jgi:hypothetical protein
MRRGRLANQAAGAQVCEGVKLIHRDETRDAAAAHRYDDLSTALDVLDVAAEAVVQLADAHLGLQRFAMWRHNGRLYALHRPVVADSRSSASPVGVKVRVTASRTRRAELAPLIVMTYDCPRASREVTELLLRGLPIDAIAADPLGQGMLTGPVRKGQQTDVVRARFLTAFSDERRLDAVEQLIPLAEEAGFPITHLAMAFAITHLAVTSALSGPRTMTHLDDLLAGMSVTLSDGILDRIDEIGLPGTDIGTLDQAHVPPAIQRPSLRRRHAEHRAAA